MQSGDLSNGRPGKQLRLCASVCVRVCVGNGNIERRRNAFRAVIVVADICFMAQRTCV